MPACRPPEFFVFAPLPPLPRPAPLPDFAGWGGGGHTNIDVVIDIDIDVNLNINIDVSVNIDIDVNINIDVTSISMLMSMCRRGSFCVGDLLRAARTGAHYVAPAARPAAVVGAPFRAPTHNFRFDLLHPSHARPLARIHGGRGRLRGGSAAGGTDVRVNALGAADQ